MDAVFDKRFVSVTVKVALYTPELAITNSAFLSVEFCVGLPSETTDH
jgi:hypothetical protein